MDITFIIMIIKKMRPGHCPVCKRNTLFISRDDWLRESYKCIFCHSRPRQRALVKVLNETVPDWQHKIIHESSPGGVQHIKCSKRHAQIIHIRIFTKRKLWA